MCIVSAVSPIPSVTHVTREVNWSDKHLPIQDSIQFNRVLGTYSLL